MTEPAPVAPSNRVPVKLADGRVGSVPKEDLDAALSGGAKVLSAKDAQYEQDQAKYGGLGDRAANLALNAASTATLGLSDYIAADELGKDYVSGIRRANPISGYVGQAAGLIVPELLTAGAYTPMGIAGALGRGAEGLVARGLGEGVLAKGLGMAAQGAIEGGAMGFGDTISEDALSDGNDGLTAEKLLAGAGKGALAGGALGFGLGAGGALVSKAVGGAGRTALGLVGRVTGDLEGLTASEAADKLAGRYAYAATGARKAEYDALARMGRDPNELGNWMLENWSRYSDKPFAVANHEDIAAVTKAMRKEYGEQVGSAIKALDQEAAASAGKVSATEGARSFIAEARKTVLEPLEANPFTAAEARKIADHLSAFEEKAALGVTDEQLAGLRSIASGGSEDAAAAAAKVAEIDAKRAGLNWETLHDWRQTLDKKLKWGATANETQQQLREMRALLEKQIDRGAESAGGIVGDAYRAAKENFGKAADLSKAAEQGVSKASANRVLGLSEQFGLVQGLMTGNPLVGVAAAAGQYGLKHYGNQVAASIFSKASQLQAMKRIVLDVDAATGSAVNGFFGKAKTTTARLPAAAAIRNVEQRVENVTRQASMSPIDRRDPHAPDPSVAPRLSNVYQQKQQAALQWLASQAPQGMAKSPLFGTIQTKPSKFELAKWNIKADVYDNPVGAIGSALKHNALTSDHVDALDAMFPELAKELRQSFFNALSDKASKGELPAEAKLRALGILLRMPTTATMTPEFIASQQELYATQQQAAQQQQQPEPSSGGNRGGNDLATGEDALDDSGS